ncbi:PREDICTED: olfactory receptor 1052-like [Gavialis gangeticus]|uniref:olfactory receptor 1052-like n=1 Tax=Gavialis gangeticus TaxID=94835 RepID=UPI00092F8D84|nr:PREDICTED: olfactory receptor 1052-like [Gavialis gangeticus]
MNSAGKMRIENRTQVSEFILLGFTDHPDLKISLFILFLLIYLLTLMGNLGIIVLINVDPVLQSPMYFFLNNLSFIDICYSSIITPRMLYDFLVKGKNISYSACAIQMWFFTLYATVECYILAVMAYDRFMAICKPLLYTVAMTKRFCVQLVAVSYLMALVNALVHTSCTFRLLFCGPNEISSYFCDIPQLLHLSCSNNYTSQVVLYVFSSFVVVGNGMIVLISYAYIVTTILKMRASTGRHKTFSTCASHLAAVVLYYGTLTFIYVQPGGMDAVEQDKLVSVFYTIVIPMLNPLIYSLRNKEVKNAMRKQIGRFFFHW